MVAKVGKELSLVVTGLSDATVHLVVNPVVKSGGQ